MRRIKAVNLFADAHAGGLKLIMGWLVLVQEGGDQGIPSGEGGYVGGSEGGDKGEGSDEDLGGDKGEEGKAQQTESLP